MIRAPAPGKINLALVVGPLREDGLHEVVTVLQRVDLCDSVTLEPADALVVQGYRKDTLVRSALAKLAAASGEGPRRARLEKRIPLTSGLGGGSTDAATALLLANRTLRSPLGHDDLVAVGAEVGADVPFFLGSGPQLAEGAGERLRQLDLPQDYWIVIALPRGARKSSTADVYRRFDERGAANGFDERRSALLAGLEAVRRPRDFAALPSNDLAFTPGPSSVIDDLVAQGAFRADVSGAGPAVYGLFHHRSPALAAGRRMRARARTWVVAPVW